MSKVEEIKAEIDQLFDIDFTDPEKVRMAGLKLRGLVTEAIQQSCGNRVAQSYTPDQINQLQQLFGRYEVNTDNRFIDDILLGRVHSPDQYPLQPIYNRLLFMEATAAEMESGKVIMHIGTGWPGTAIGLYRQFGIPVICVEKDPQFAQRSKEGLAKLDLLGNDKLQVICADGCDLSTEGYQAVIVSAMVPNEDKMRIIRNMREIASGDLSDPVLVLRTSADRARSLFYQQLSDEIWGDKDLTLVSDTNSSVMPEDPLRSLVFRVKEMAEVRRGSDRILLSARSRLQPAGNFTA